MAQKSLTLTLEVFGMDELSSALTPKTVVVRFTAKTLAAIDYFVELMNSNERIQSLSLDLPNDGFETTYLNDEGKDTELDSLLDFELFLDASNKGSHIRAVVSGCDTEIYMDDEFYTATGEFFVNIPVADLRNLLQAD
jgi:hypothetical protein